MDGRPEQGGKGKGIKIALFGGIAAVLLAVGSYFAFIYESGPVVPLVNVNAFVVEL